MSDFSLDRKFFELWCLTLTGLSLQEALRQLGVDDPAPLTDALQRIDDRIVEDDGRLLLAARKLPAGLTLLFSQEAIRGWIGERHDVLERLSTPDQSACTAFADPNRTALLAWETGPVACGLDPQTGRRWGPMSPTLDAAFTEAGFSPDAMGLTGPLEGANRTDSTFAAIRVVTGIELRAEDFSGPWIGGFAPNPGAPPQQARRP